jgi:hypothetical protein
MFDTSSQVNAYNVHGRAQLTQVAGADGVLTNAVVLWVHVQAKIHRVEIANDGDVHIRQDLLQGSGSHFKLKALMFMASSCVQVLFSS